VGDAVSTGDIAGVERAQAALAATIADLTDEVALGPSLLPGWSVGHVLSHIARNADSVVRRLEGAAAGRVVDQYGGGAAGRARDIEAGSGRPAAELVADVLATNGAVEAALAAFPDAAWDRVTRSVSGSEQPARDVVFSRWREVEVHHVDLGLGYTPAQWPGDLVERWLPHARAQFLDTVDQRTLLAWLVGRAPAPQLKPWG
jgi:maleylpyruvate isomerase